MKAYLYFIAIETKGGKHEGRNTGKDRHLDIDKPILMSKVIIDFILKCSTAHMNEKKTWLN
jgi:hypothetical protein